MTNKELLEQAIARFNDPSQRREYLELYSEDAKMYGYHGVEPGREGIGRFYEALWTAIPDASVALEHILECGDEVVARFTMTGRHDGPLMGIPPTGKAVTLPGITILRFRDGQVVERWSQTDFYWLLQQIGAVPDAG